MNAILNNQISQPLFVICNALLKMNQKPKTETLLYVYVLYYIIISIRIAEALLFENIVPNRPNDIRPEDFCTEVLGHMIDLSE